MTTDTKRTRLDGAFAQIPTVVRQGYVTLADVKRVRKYSGKKEWLLQIVEWCNRYCHTADQPGIKKTTYHIGVALREQYGRDEAAKCLSYAGDYRDLIPSHLWSKSWFTRKDVAVGRPGSGHHKQRIENRRIAVVPSRLEAMAVVGAFDQRYAEINQQLFEVSIHLGNLDRELANRATPDDIRGLVQKAFNDYDFRFEESHNQLEKRYRDHAFTDAWQKTIEALRGELDHHCRFNKADAITVDRWITRIEEKADAAKDEAHKVTYLSSVVAKHILKDHRHRLPNPLRPVMAVVRRARLALKVLLRGEEIPFR